MRHKEGYDIYIEPHSYVARLAEQEQENRLIEDAWADKVMTFVEKMKEVTMDDIMMHLSIDTAKRDENVMRRIGRILRAAKWERKQRRIEGLPKRIWCNPNISE